MLQILLFLLHSHENQSKILGYQEWVEILVISLISSQKSPNPNISAPIAGRKDRHMGSITYLYPLTTNSGAEVGEFILFLQT